MCNASFLHLWVIPSVSDLAKQVLNQKSKQSTQLLWNHLKVPACSLCSLQYKSLTAQWRNMLSLFRHFSDISQDFSIFCFQDIHLAANYRKKASLPKVSREYKAKKQKHTRQGNFWNHHLLSFPSPFPALLIAPGLFCAAWNQNVTIEPLESRGEKRLFKIQVDRL